MLCADLQIAVHQCFSRLLYSVTSRPTSTVVDWMDCGDTGKLCSPMVSNLKNNFVFGKVFLFLLCRYVLKR